MSQMQNSNEVEVFDDKAIHAVTVLPLEEEAVAALKQEGDAEVGLDLYLLSDEQQYSEKASKKV